MVKNLKKAICLSLICCVEIFANDISKTTTLDAINVTANKFDENINEEPQSLSIITSEEFEEKEIKNIFDLLKSVPSMYVGSGLNERINVRGLNYSMFSHSNPVTMYVNGVSQSLSYGYNNLSLSNIERIEILRGPQSTIYGKDSIGGVINIIKKEPRNKLEASLGLEYGTNNYIQGVLSTSGAIVKDKFYLSLDAVASKDDGWIKNTLKGGEKANDKKRQDFSTTFKFTPSDELSFKLNTSTNKLRDNFIDGLFKYTINEAKNVSRKDIKNQAFEIPSYSKVGVNSGAFSIAYDLEKMKFTSITTYKKNNMERNLDYAFNDDPSLNDFYSFEDFEAKTLAQEFRISSEKPFKYVTGIYYESEKIDSKYLQELEGKRI